MILPSMCVVISELLCGLFTVARKNLICWCKQRDFVFAAGMGPRLMSILMPFNQHSSAFYLRSKLYLVVNISSDIVTKSCCQVCVPSTMTARVCQLRLPAVYQHARGEVEQTQAATCWQLTADRPGPMLLKPFLMLWILVIIHWFRQWYIAKSAPKNYMFIVTMLNNCHCKIM